MFAFLVNALAVIIGSIIGLILKKNIKEEICENILKVVGIIVLIIGIVGVLENMITIENNKIISNGTIELLICIAGGTIIGELLNIDGLINSIFKKIEIKLNKGSISEGLVTSSLIYCVGSMAIIGSMNSALGNPDIIYLKSILDGITSIALASTLGFGVLLSSISVIVYQGILTLLFYFLKDFMPIDFISLFNMIGYVIVTAIGFNFIMKNKIKVANMLPSLLLVILYYSVTYLLIG